MSENYSEYNETNISVVSPSQASQYQSKGKWRMAAREKIIQIVQRELKIVRIYNWKYLIPIILKYFRIKPVAVSHCKDLDRGISLRSCAVIDNGSSSSHDGWKEHNCGCHY